MDRQRSVAAIGFGAILDRPAAEQFAASAERMPPSGFIRAWRACSVFGSTKDRGMRRSIQGFLTRVAVSLVNDLDDENMKGEASFHWRVRRL
jgi:hypothetical protein